MIVNFWMSKSKNQLATSELSPDKFYSINFLNIDFILREKINKKQIFELQTNLIERSGFNPMRTVGFFIPSIGSIGYSYSPTQKMYYKLSLTSFKSPVFIIRCPATGKIIDFEEISIQVEIRETNGWF